MNQQEQLFKPSTGAPKPKRYSAIALLKRYEQRIPIDERHTAHRRLANLVGVTPKLVQRRLDGTGLTGIEADLWATRCHLHPDEIWERYDLD